MRAVEPRVRALERARSDEWDGLRRATADLLARYGRWVRVRHALC